MWYPPRLTLLCFHCYNQSGVEFGKNKKDTVMLYNNKLWWTISPFRSCCTPHPRFGVLSLATASICGTFSKDCPQTTRTHRVHIWKFMFPGTALNQWFVIAPLSQVSVAALWRNWQARVPCLIRLWLPSAVLPWDGTFAWLPLLPWPASLPPVLASPRSTSLISPLHTNSHLRVCSWESKLSCKIMCHFQGMSIYHKY